MAAVTRSSWKTLPAPTAREPIEFQADYSAAQYAVLAAGVVPRDMDDRWFVYVEDGWLNFHRSWTGVHVFALRLEPDGAGWHVVDSWANRNVEQYKGSTAAGDRDFVRSLIDTLILKTC